MRGHTPGFLDRLRCAFFGHVDSGLGVTPAYAVASTESPDAPAPPDGFVYNPDYLNEGTVLRVCARCGSLHAPTIPVKLLEGAEASEAVLEELERERRVAEWTAVRFRSPSVEEQQMLAVSLEGLIKKPMGS